MVITNSTAAEHEYTGREVRALALYRAHEADIVLVDTDVWSVPSGSRAGLYHEVTYPAPTVEGETCSCEDFAFRGESCVHLYQAAIKASKRSKATRLLASVFAADE